MLAADCWLCVCFCFLCVSCVFLVCFLCVWIRVHSGARRPTHLSTPHSLPTDSPLLHSEAGIPAGLPATEVLVRGTIPTSSSKIFFVVHHFESEFIFIFILF